MDPGGIGFGVNMLLLTIAAWIGSSQLRDAIEVSRTDVIEMPSNSDTSVERILLRLIDQAQQEIVMYGGNDPTEESPYRSKLVVDALKEKLRNPEFRLACVLDFRTGETLFERELEPLRNVTIRTRRENPSTIHYKIFDGTVGYISRHRPGGTVRNRKLIDCTRAQSRHPGERPLALRRYFNDFNRYAA